MAERNHTFLGVPQQTVYTTTTQLKQGWQCPLCKVVYSPMWPKCECAANQSGTAQRPTFRDEELTDAAD